MLNNPGRVITHYQFSLLFGQAWMKAMIPRNIISGFRVTPTDRYKILPKSPPKRPQPFVNGLVCDLFHCLPLYVTQDNHQIT